MLAATVLLSLPQFEGLLILQGAFLRPLSTLMVQCSDQPYVAWYLPLRRGDLQVRYAARVEPDGILTHLPLNPTDASAIKPFSAAGGFTRWPMR